MAAPPEALKQIKPYVTLAGQLDQKNEKVVAYYCRLYSVQTGMPSSKTHPDCKKFLIQLMDVLEATKKQNPNDEAMQSETAGQAYVEEYALKIFEKADMDDRNSRFDKNLVKQFYSAGLLFDVLNCFGDLSEDLVVKKQYAKRKAMYLNRCFQTGQTPIPGPLVGDGFDDSLGQDESRPKPSDNSASNYDGSNYGAGASHGTGASYNQQPDRPASSKAAKNSPSNQVNNYHSTYDEPETHQSNDSALPPEVVQKAQKLCKYAQSALQYDDTTTAINQLEQCLKLLKTGKE